jgi:hypothetical protein
MTQTAVKPLENDILEILSSGVTLSLDELWKEIQNRRTDVASSEVRAAILPLINIQRIHFTNDRKLRIVSTA